jgi:cation:H+ antiporter
MMVQVTVPTSLCLLFMPWLLERTLLVSAGLTALAIGILFLLFHRREVRTLCWPALGG